MTNSRDPRNASEAPRLLAPPAQTLVSPGVPSSEVRVTTASLRAAAEPEVTHEHAGRYQLAADAERGELGRGGIGRVFAALDRHMQREVAIKELLADASGDGIGAPSHEATLRFLREARVTGQLEHPAIVPVYELGRRADGTLYYAMRIVRGRTLARAIADAKSLPERLALVNHFSGLCQAIAYAHSRGVVHRDVKPENVMVGEFGETVVLDWGTAKVRALDDPNEEGSVDPLRARDSSLDETVEGSIYGTPLYMSPEQALGRVNDVDERSDVWALGVVLYAILAGRPPFEGKNFLEVRERVRLGRFTPLAQIDPAVPRELAAIAERALRASPADRYANAKEMAGDVQAYQAGQRVGAYDYSSFELLTRFLARHRAAVIASAVGLAASLVLAIVSYRRVVAARDRALSAEHRAVENEQSANASASAARRSLGEVLVEKALLAQSEGDTIGAELLAAHAMDLDERPDARGIALAAESSARPTPAAQFPDLAGCDRYAFARPALIACSKGASLRVWDAREGKLVWEESAAGDVVSLAVSSDATTLVAVSAGGQVRVYRPAAGRAAPVAERRIAGARSAAVSPDGERAAVGTSYGIVVAWAVQGGQVDRSYNLGQAVSALSFAPRAPELVAGGELGAVSFWEWRTGKERKLKGHTGTVRALAFAREGRVLASGAADRTVRLWDLQDDRPIAEPMATDDVVTSIAWSSDGRTLALAGKNGFRLLDPRASGRGVLVKHEDGVELVSFVSEKGQLASVTRGAGLRLWSFEAREFPSQVVERGNVLSLVFDPKTENLLSAGLGRNGVSIWDLASGSCSTRLPTTVERVRALAAAPGGDRLAVGGSGGKVFVWDLTQRLPILVLDAHRDEVRAIDFSRDGRRLASAGVDRSVHVFDAANGNESARFEAEGALLSLRFLPEAPVLLTGDRDGMLELWDLIRNQRADRWKAHDDWVLGVAVSPDSKWFASGGADRLVKLWNAQTRKVAFSMAGHEGKITSIDFSPDGSLLASGSEDQSVRIWDVPTGRELARLAGHEGTVRSVRFALHRDMLATAGDDGTIRLWRLGDLRLPPREMLARTEQRFGVDLFGTRVTWTAPRR